VYHTFVSFFGLVMIDDFRIEGQLSQSWIQFGGN
jgi:hypothetical protein